MLITTFHHHSSHSFYKTSLLKHIIIKTHYIIPFIHTLLLIHNTPKHIISSHSSKHHYMFIISPKHITSLIHTNIFYTLKIVYFCPVSKILTLICLGPLSNLTHLRIPMYLHDKYIVRLYTKP
jgi:hypothetical protein